MQSFDFWTYGFVDERDLLPAVLSSLVEGESAKSFRVPLGHDLQAFDNALHVFVLQSRIFTWEDYGRINFMINLKTILLLWKLNQR